MPQIVKTDVREPMVLKVSCENAAEGAWIPWADVESGANQIAIDVILTREKPLLLLGSMVALEFADQGYGDSNLTLDTIRPFVWYNITGVIESESLRIEHMYTKFDTIVRKYAWLCSSSGILKRAGRI
jgi:hypothetical protein